MCFCVWCDSPRTSADGAQWVNCYGSFFDRDFKTQRRTVTLKMSYIFVPVSEPEGEARFSNS